MPNARARLRPEALRFQPWLGGQWEKISRALDMFEAAPPSGTIDMEHIALACALAYLDFRHDARGWRNSRPQLAAWQAVMQQRAAMVATAPPAA